MIRKLIFLAAIFIVAFPGGSVRGAAEAKKWKFGGGCFLETQDYFPTEDLARLPHDEPRLTIGGGLGLENGLPGFLGIQAGLDVNNPLHKGFHPDFRLNYRYGLRWRSLPLAHGIRLELTGERVVNRVGYLSEDMKAKGWGMQCGLSFNLIGKNGTTTYTGYHPMTYVGVSIGYGWENFGSLERFFPDDPSPAIPASTEKISMNREGWFVRVVKMWF
jgi:hypothetical protein